MTGQAVFDLRSNLREFVTDFAAYGYESESALVCAALTAFQDELAPTQLADSAALYAELYATDADPQVLVEQAIEGWPD